MKALNKRKKTFGIYNGRLEMMINSSLAILNSVFMWTLFIKTDCIAAIETFTPFTPFHAVSKFRFLVGTASQSLVAYS